MASGASRCSAADVFAFRRKFCLWLILSGTGLYFFANIQRVAIPGAIFDLLQSDLHLEAPGVAALGSVFMLVYALNQLLIGLFVGRYGGRRVILPGALLFCLGSLLFPLSAGGWLYVSRALTGFGASSLYLALIDETIRACRKNYAIAVSLVITAGYAGGIVANAPFVAVVRTVGWRQTLLGIAGATIFFYLLFVMISSLRRFPPIRRDVPFHFAPFLQVLGERNNRLVFLVGGLNFGLYYVIQTVLGKKFLEDFCDFSSSGAAWILSLTGLISAVSGTLLAVLSRLAGNRRSVFCRIAGIVCASSFSLITLMLLADLRSGWIAPIFCLLASTGSISSITIPLLHETNPRHLAGSAVCFLNFSFYLTVGVFGNLSGWLLNCSPPEMVNQTLVYSRNSYLAVFAVLTLASLAVLFGAVKLRDRQTRQKPHQKKQ